MKGRSKALLILVPLLFVLITPVAASEEGTTYVVKAGDSLYAIGLSFHVQWQSIADANNIPPPYTIYPGQSLKVPSPACSDPKSSATYAVQRGDYLSSIGRKLGVEWQGIAEANCIAAPYLIYPGQVLVIPSGESGQGSS
ncbi:MAG: LysM peptidoglycan-binding domain-containing protein [Thaumarchaeota archaeon]|nr:LysM peptidoglycan-binding domain-containing protein [Nitrososphaerota archaeon]